MFSPPAPPAKPVVRICAMPVEQEGGGYLYYNTDDNDSEPCREEDFALSASPSSGQVFFACDRPENGWKCKLELDPGQDYRLTVGNFGLSIDRPTP
ncbi:MAG: hypothetical protein V1716_03140 [Candidatus Uhrbacteria bacterium]